MSAEPFASPIPESALRGLRYTLREAEKAERGFVRVPTGTVRDLLDFYEQPAHSDVREWLLCIALGGAGGFLIAALICVPLALLAGNPPHPIALTLTVWTGIAFLLIAPRVIRGLRTRRKGEG